MRRFQHGHSAARGTAAVADSVTQVNRHASETGTLSARVLSATHALSGEAGRLKTEVGAFIQRINCGIHQTRQPTAAEGEAFAAAAPDHSPRS